MLKLFSVLLVVVLALGSFGLASAQEIECFDSEGSTVSILGVWAGEEEETFKAVLDPVLAACDLTLQYEGTRDLATVLSTRVDGGEPPDIASLPNPGSLLQYADALVALEEVGVNGDNYVQGWKDLGSVDGVWLGLPIKTDIKSLVWYSPIAFEAAGYTVPTTLDELLALAAQMSADGIAAPFSMGFESGGATGWTATDFVQDILLRTEGAEFTNGLATGETSFDDPGVVEAWESYALLASAFGAGGADGAITTPFGDAVLLPFQDPPGAWMVKQSGFAGTAFIAPNFPDYVYGEDFAFFVLPTEDGEPAPMQVGGDFMGVFNNTPATQAVIAYLSSAEGAAAWAASGFDLTPNAAVTADAYTDPISADKAAALGAAPDVSFDVGDLLPAGLGQAEFDGITAVVGGADAAETLAGIAELFAEATE